MDEVHRRHTQDRDSLVSDIADTEKSIETCQEKVAGLEARYRFFQEMRGYVRDLVDCLSEKVGVSVVTVETLGQIQGEGTLLIYYVYSSWENLVTEEKEKTEIGVLFIHSYFYYNEIHKIWHPKFWAWKKIGISAHE